VVSAHKWPPLGSGLMLNVDDLMFVSALTRRSARCATAAGSAVAAVERANLVYLGLPLFLTTTPSARWAWM